MTKRSCSMRLQATRHSLFLPEITTTPSLDLQVLSLLRPRIANTRIGLEFKPDGLAIAVSRTGRFPSNKNIDCYWIPSAPNKRLLNLERAVKNLRLEDCLCQIVVPHTDYQRIEIDRPDVPPEELAQASQWAVRHVLDEQVEDFHVEYFDYPQEALRGRNARINLRLARNSVIDAYAQSARAAGLKPKFMTTSDLALKNLGETIADTDQLKLLLWCGDDSALLLIHKAGQLYFARDFNLARRNDQDLERVIQGLAVEVQRSIDFFEGQTGLVTPKMLSLLSLLGEDDRATLSSLLGYPVRAVALQGKLKGIDGLSDSSDNGLFKAQIALAGVCSMTVAGSSHEN